MSRDDREHAAEPHEPRVECSRCADRVPLSTTTTLCFRFRLCAPCWESELADCSTCGERLHQDELYAVEFERGSHCLACAATYDRPEDRYPGRWCSDVGHR